MPAKQRPMTFIVEMNRHALWLERCGYRKAALAFLRKAVAQAARNLAQDVELSREADIQIRKLDLDESFREFERLQKAVSDRQQASKRGPSTAPDASSRSAHMTRSGKKARRAGNRSSKAGL